MADVPVLARSGRCRTGRQSKKTLIIVMCWQSCCWRAAASAPGSPSRPTQQEAPGGEAGAAGTGAVRGARSTVRRQTRSRPQVRFLR